MNRGVHCISQRKENKANEYEREKKSPTKKQHVQNFMKSRIVGQKWLHRVSKTRVACSSQKLRETRETVVY